MRVLVTGANGFVGSHVLQTLVSDPRLEVVAACRDASRLPDGFEGEIRVGDLRDPAYLDGVCDGIDTLCHAAAWTSLFGHTDASQKLFLEPSLALIESAKRAGVRHFLNHSTTSAAAPGHSADPDHPGIERSFWPHLSNVVRIENWLRETADTRFRVTNLRLGIFIGARYNLGLLPILVPRLKTHLVPWVKGGRTTLPLIAGEDIGHAYHCAVHNAPDTAWRGLNVVGPEIPTTREVIDYLHRHHDLPAPHFSVPFPLAYAFAGLMEWLNPLSPWDPLVTRSIVHLLEETGANNTRAADTIGYTPTHHWRDTIDRQLAEMATRERRPMPMARPVNDAPDRQAS